MFGFFKNIGKRSLATTTEPGTWLIDAIGGRRSRAGARVSAETAVQVSAVYACVRILSEAVASLPLIVYRRRGEARERATDRSDYRVLHSQWNPRMTSFTARQTMLANILLHGDAFAEIVFDGEGHCAALWPIHPRAVLVEAAGPRLRYTVQPLDGSEPVDLPQENMVHVPGLGDGIRGISPLRAAREAIGLAIELESYAAEFFGNGAHAGGVLESEKPMNKEVQARLKASWQQAYGRHELDSKTGWHKVAVLEDGLKWKPNTVSPKDAMALESRKFQIEEIARVFGVPLHLIGDLTRSTYSNIEQQSLEFLTVTLRPWLVRIEQELNVKLFATSLFYCEHLVDSYARADLKSRYEAYQTAIASGWMSANDVRRLENLPPVDGADGLLRPTNMGVVGET